MKRLIITSLAALALGVTALVTGVAPLSAATSPLKATYTGTIQVTSADPSGNPMTAAYGGTGVGQHLGASQMNGVISVLGPAPSCAAGGFTARHTDTLTAADGSKLFVQVEEVACAEGPGAYHCVGTYVVTGGTGRFAGATGSGTFDGHVTFNPNGSGTFQATYAGSVSVGS